MPLALAERGAEPGFGAWRHCFEVGGREGFRIWSCWRAERWCAGLRIVVGSGRVGLDSLLAFGTRWSRDGVAGLR
ncbi:hypothetical protein KC19_12G135200 [Ceratodon purpureus]|uniref:Uncharacterized protein n=1 Tax=Ceratodon purpureus TaxID=3225 RepID=A0A8T0G9F0_CERPU|nr:hypothetical protein KC19_12G135200 [Ceratodon purpureus]